MVTFRPFLCDKYVDWHAVTDAKHSSMHVRSGILPGKRKSKTVDLSHLTSACQHQSRAIQICTTDNMHEARVT